jgi:hypothetical protein
MDKKHFGSSKIYIIQAIFIVLACYSVSSINVLLFSVFILAYVPRTYFDVRIVVGYASIALVLTLLVSAYHIRSMFRRKSRKTDR